MNPEQRILRARIAAHRMHAAGKTNTAPARAAFDERFVNEVDPERKLSPAERAKRVEHARRAYFLRLSAAGVQARRRSSS